MIPASYHEYFTGCVTVAGALIGLLFVAISVAPHKMAGEQASVSFQVRAGVAFTALINTLVISLVALLPGTHVGWAGVAVSLTGLSSTAGLGIVALRNPDITGRRWWTAIRFGLLAGVLLYQLEICLDLLVSPHDSSQIDTEAILLLVCFLIAIDRAWELLGGSNQGLISLLIGRGQQRAGGLPRPEADQP